MANSRAVHLAAELRAARRHRNLTQSQLASTSGVSVRTIHQIEREKATAKAWQLIAL
ncbi:helix-turn-helix transcriptional regulator, partial [Nocardia otitidiscaviarum]